VAYNNLAQIVANIAASMGDSLVYTAITPGGTTLQGHWTTASTTSQIAQPGWDFVVLQAQSQEPSFPPSQVAASTFPYAALLDSLAKANNPCTEVLYFMTWGRKYGDAQNCASYPVICTYDGMQTRLRDSYVQMANDNNSSVSPVGQVWRSVRAQDSTIELYNPDQSHPSIAGSYLAATTFYVSMFHKELSSTSFVPAGVDAVDAALIRNTAYSIVMDSIETWQGHGAIPLARFTPSPSTLAVNCVNTSMRYTTSDWYWGDANSTLLSSTPNVLHTYAASGTYTISMTANSGCKSDSTSMPVVIPDIPNGIQASGVDATSVTVQMQNIVVNSGDGYTLQLYTIDGRLLQDAQVRGTYFAIPVQHKGVVLFRLQKVGLQKTGTVVIQ
jgi:PKD repeat protein